MSSFYLAWRYLLHNRIRSLVLVACIALMAVLPLALNLLLAEVDSFLQSRANTTPLLVGAKGSPLELTMNALYFAETETDQLPVAFIDEINSSELASAIPLHILYNARGFPIVGTRERYIHFRGLRVASGTPSFGLGECVIGKSVADELGLQVGDSLVSSPDSLFDVAGVYPLKMTVAAVLDESQSADDRAIFVSLDTTWLISGLVHGHSDLALADASVKLNHDKGALGSKLVLYSEVTDENRDSFHGHEGVDTLPVSAIIVVPESEKAGVILQGRYLQSDLLQQIVSPADVIDGLLQDIFRVKKLLDGVVLIVGSAALLAVMLVFSLSFRLRQRELETNYRIGCARLMTLRLVAAECVLIILAAMLLVLPLLMLLSLNARPLIASLLM